MATAAPWFVERAAEDVVDCHRLRPLAGWAVLAANLALLMLPPAVAALALLGLIR